MKHVLEGVISEYQSAFAPRRLTDNAVVEFECMHKIRARPSSYDDFFSSKVCMSKAYDGINVDFCKEDDASVRIFKLLGGENYKV